MDSQTHIPGKTESLKELDELPLFFIVGRGRSGSTLLRSMLDAHPSVMIPLESRFVQFLYYNFAVQRPWSREQAVRAIEALESGFEPLNLDRESLMEQIDKHGSHLSLDRVCKLIYLNTQSGFRKDKIRILGDKNPRYTFFIPQLLRLFPGAKFIHLVRDYRDNIVSIQRAGKLIGESGNPYYAMGRWCLYNRYALKYQKRYPDIFYRLHFEDLIRDPEAVMIKLCKFLELEYNPGLLNYREGMDNYFEDKGFNELHQSLRTSFDTAKIGEWERELTERTAIRCEVLGGSFPGKIGYPSGFHVHLLRRAGIKLLYYPIMLLGQCRFLLKILFYRSRFIMKAAYCILLKVR